jgi:hypothetical protein
MRIWFRISTATLVAVTSVTQVEAFLNARQRYTSCNRCPPILSLLYLQKRWFSPDSDDDHDDDKDDGESEDRMVTREMLHRDLLQDPQVKRKRKNGKEGYKPLDNRDHLPFSVREVTPDPYTHKEIKKARQKRSGGQHQRKRTDLDHHLTQVSKKKNASGSMTSSRLVEYNNKNGRDTSTVLGEFQLDKSTTSGDIIVVGDKEYQVQTARCQYKYAGGQRFVMVRKILEVKEMTRVYKEEALWRQYESSPSRLPDQPPPNLE